MFYNQQEYNNFIAIQNQIFKHTKLYHPNLLTKIGMDSEFKTIFNGTGWQSFWHADDKDSKIFPH